MKTVTKFALALGLLVFAGYVGVWLRYMKASRPGMAHVDRGKVSWCLLDEATDTSILLVNGICVARGSLELYIDGNWIVGNCWSDGKGRIFAGNLTNNWVSIDWYDTFVQCPRPIRKMINFRRMKTFVDFRNEK